MRTYIDLSKKIYTIRRFVDYRRVLVFIIRSLIQYKFLGRLISFFQLDHLRSKILEKFPGIIEQATRKWLYRGSTLGERLTIITEHFRFFQRRFTEEGLRQMYLKDGISLWSDQYLGQSIFLKLLFNTGHRKEGLAAVELYLEEKRIYRTIFWVAPDKQNEMSIWVGALQGSPGDLDLIRKLTKHFFGYRVKNLVLFASRIVAQQLGLGRIYAISNHGFYANNHFRFDRKLKTSLDEFWQETGGTLTEDRRFFRLPVGEPKKELDEVESHKRNLYRKRFTALEAIEAQMAKNLSSFLVTPGDSQPEYSFFIPPRNGSVKHADKDGFQHESLIG